MTKEMRKKRKGVKTRLLALILGLGLLAGLTGCQGKLSKNFDKQQVTDKAQEMVEEISKGNLQQVYEETFTPVMKNGIKVDDLQENGDYLLGDKGAFQGFARTQIKGIKDKDTDTEYATALVLAEYENGKALFTISFDKNMQCAGFYMK